MKHIVTVLVLCVSSVLALGQPTAFTYQGRLNDGPSPATGTYDLRFTVYDALTAGSAVSSMVTNAATSVSNGVFTVTLDFGADVFTGANRWMEIDVRTNGATSFATLAPRQPITSTPYAITAGTVTGPLSSSALSGVFSNAVTFSNAANQFAGTFTGNGAGLTNVNALTLDGLGPNAFWKLAGNNVAPGDFLGSTNNQPVEVRANGQRALRLEPTAGGTPNVIGGSTANQVDAGIGGATIGGGSANRVAADLSVIAGGSGNIVESNSSYSMIAGGGGNAIGNQSMASTIGGGFSNTNNSPYSFLGGGILNNVQAGSSFAVLGGGFQNVIGSNLFVPVLAGGWMNALGGSLSFLGSGEGNVISNTASHAGIVGGTRNIITGGGAFIGGGYQNRAENFDSTVAGGAFNANSSLRGFIGAGENNSNAGPHSLIGAGVNNTIEPNNSSAAIVGGANNVIRDNVWYGFIGGGNVNTIHPGSGYSVIAGGWQNTIQSDAGFSVIAGGVGNTDASGYSAIGGGDSNFIGTNSSHSTIAGGNRNTITNALWATIAGGQFNTNSGRYAFIGGGLRNNVEGFQSVLGGGVLNSISLNSSVAVIGGGSRNVILGNTSGDVIGGGFNNVIDTITLAGTVAGGWSNMIRRTDAATIAGGFRNSIEFGGDYSFIGGGALNTNHGFLSLVAGGRNNTILPSADHSVISGGRGNRITGSTSEVYAAIGGGQGNTVLTNAPYATIPGGFSNVASAYSFAAGNRAKAIHQGSFVWADSTNADFTTTASNQFLIRASGGVGIGTPNPTTALEVMGTVKAGGFMDNGSGFSGNGGGLTNVNATTLGGVAPSNYWRLGGNFISSFPLSLGTVEQYPMTFIAGNRTALRLEPGSRFQFPLTTLTAPNVIGGSEANVASNGVLGATIAGGGQVFSVIGPGTPSPNVVSDDFGTISGGINNTAGNTNANISDARASTVGGGENNVAAANYATVPGGANNVAEGQLSFAAGHRAKARHQGAFVWADSTDADFSSTDSNQFLIRAAWVGIGTNSPQQQLSLTRGMNIDQSDANNAGVPNGLTFGSNSGEAIASKRTPGGNRWGLDFYTGFLNRMTILNTGNVGIGTTNPASRLHSVATAGNGMQGSSSDLNASGIYGENTSGHGYGVAGRASGTGRGIFGENPNPGGYAGYFVGGVQVDGNLCANNVACPSDRNVKTDFAPVDAKAILEKVAGLAITRWRYTNDTSTPHIGPVAQDFHAAFGVGSNDKQISTVDADGVALAAIQGLNQKLEEKDSKISALEKRLADLEKLVSRLANNASN